MVFSILYNPLVNSTGSTLDKYEQINMRALKFLFFVFLFTATLYAQSNDECLACHSDNSLTMEKRGKTVSLFVDEQHLGSSSHKKFACTACHTGFASARHQGTSHSFRGDAGPDEEKIKTTHRAKYHRFS